MFERFTERARQVVVLAQSEARALDHHYIGTEHLLLGILGEEEGIGGRVLRELGVDLAGARSAVEAVVGRGDTPTHGQIPFTPRAKASLEYALRESLSLGHAFLGTEHILLGLVRLNEGVAMRILLDFDVDGDRVRGAIFDALGPQVPRRHRRAFRGRMRRAPLALHTGRVRWEYRIERRDQLDAEWLNELGDDGWELVDVLPGDAFTLVFKRVCATARATAEAG